MSHNTIVNYYTTIFALVQHHKYSIEEIENLMPYERDIYVELLSDMLEKERQELEKR